MTTFVIKSNFQQNTLATNEKKHIMYPILNTISIMINILIQKHNEPPTWLHA